MSVCGFCFYSDHRNGSSLVLVQLLVCHCSIYGVFLLVESELDYSKTSISGSSVAWTPSLEQTVSLPPIELPIIHLKPLRRGCL